MSNRYKTETRRIIFSEEKQKTKNIRKGDLIIVNFIGTMIEKEDDQILVQYAPTMDRIWMKIRNIKKYYFPSHNHETHKDRRLINCGECQKELERRENNVK